MLGYLPPVLPNQPDFGDRGDSASQGFFRPLPVSLILSCLAMVVRIAASRLSIAARRFHNTLIPLTSKCGGLKNTARPNVVFFNSLLISPRLLDTTPPPSLPLILRLPCECHLTHYSHHDIAQSIPLGIQLLCPVCVVVNRVMKE